jgi:multidrug resistance protein
VTQTEATLKSPKAILFLTIFIDLFGFSVVIPILPNYVKALTNVPVMVGFVAAIFSVMQFLFTPVWGAMSDKYGRRPIILASLFGSSIAYVMFSFATTIPMLLLARALSGIGSGNISAAQAYISDITAPANRAKSMGLIGAAFGLGFIFGPPVGGFIMSELGFEYIGYFCALLCSVNLAFAYFFLPESLKAKNQNSKITILPIDQYKRVFSSKILAPLFMINFIYISAFFFFQINSPLLWNEKYHLNDKQIGFVFSFIGICTAIVQGGLIGILNRKMGEFHLLLYGNLILGVSIALIPFVPVQYFWFTELPLLLFMALSNGFIGPSNLALVSKNTDPGEQGATMGLFQSFGSLARVVGPVLGSALYGIAYFVPYLAAFLLILINVGIVVLVVRNKIAV